MCTYQDLFLRLQVGDFVEVPGPELARGGTLHVGGRLLFKVAHLPQVPLERTHLTVRAALEPAFALVHFSSILAHPARVGHAVSSLFLLLLLYHEQLILVRARRRPQLADVDFAILGRHVTIHVLQDLLIVFVLPVGGSARFADLVLRGHRDVALA